MPRHQQELTPLQARFVEEYLKDLRGSDAVRRAGFITKYPDKVAYILLGKRRVKQAINEAKIARTKRSEITADRVLQEAGRLAFLDVRQLYHDDGSLKPVSQWPDEVAAAVAGIETVERYQVVDGKKVPMGTLKKIRLWDKPGQLTLLAKHLKLLHDEPAQNVVNIQINVRTSLAEALQHAYSAPGSPSTNLQRSLSSGSEPVG